MSARFPAQFLLYAMTGRLIRSTSDSFFKHGDKPRQRTNLFRSLYQFVPYAEQYGIKASHHQYPLDRNFGGVYTPDAIYFRESEQKGYALLEKPVSLVNPLRDKEEVIKHLKGYRL